MHEILSRHPSFLAFEEKVGKLDEAEAAWRERTSAARADYKAQVADYRREKQAALLSGSEPPVEPEPLPDNSDEARLFLDQRSALRARRRDLLADLAPEVEDAAHRRWREIADEARPHVDALEKLADESRELVATVRMTLVPAERRDADAVPPGHGRGDRMRHSVSVGDLVDIIANDGSPFDPVAPPGPRMIAATFEAPPRPEDEPPSPPSPARDRTPAPIQVKGA
jgi:hypothetical protein